MYNYDFKKTHESILKEAIDVNIKIGKEYLQTRFVLTENNLLVFYDLNRGNPIWGAGTYTLPNLYLLFSVPKKNIVYKIEDNNLYLIVNKEKINCYDFDLKKFLT